MSWAGRQAALPVLAAGDPDRPGPQLPTDLPRTPDLSFEPAEYEFVLPPLPEIAGAIPADGQMTFLAGLAALFYRYTQQQTFHLHVALTPGERGLIVPVDVDDERSLRELARDLVVATSSAAPNRGRAGDGRARLPVAVVFLNQGPSGEWPAEWASGALGRDLHLGVSVGSDRVAVRALYNARLFYRASIERLGGHLGVLAGALAQNLDTPVSALPLLAPAETKTLLVDWASLKRPYPSKPLHRYVEDHAREQPEAVAVSCNDASLTYAELDRRANQVAHHLIAEGVKAGDRVAVCIEPSVDIAVCVLGIFKAGAAHVPLDPGYPADRLAVIIEDTQPAALLTQARPFTKLPPVSVPVLCLDRDADKLSVAPEGDPGRDVPLGDTAFVVYTSGTTGKPKGVMITHANLIHYLLVARDRYGFCRTDVMPAFARFTFSITMFELFSPLVSGGRLVILEREHVLDFKRLVPTLQQSTAFHASPSLLRKLLAYVTDNGIAPASFARLRHVSSGGDMVSADLMEGLKRVFQDAELFVIYGCSEVSCMGCTYPIPRDQLVTRSKVGKPFENVSVRLYDARGNMVPIGVAGEIYFGGAGVARGYLNRDELTREKFVEIDGERFYRTGDVGRFDADGNLEILGRSDFQIKLRGIRIELGDIEATLRQATGVREGVVAARELGGDEKSLVAYVVPEPSRAPNVKEIRRFMQVKLPDYMVPTAYVLLDALPVNINQKVDRRALPEPTAEDLARLRTFDPPRNERERKLVEIWERVLGVSPIGIRDSFFDAGGNSLQSVALMVEIERAFARALPLSAILTDPTIEKMAALLEPGGDVRSSVVLLREGGPLPPIFFVHDGEGEIIPYRNLAMRLSRAHPIYGIQPLSRRDHPILHTRLSEIVDYYTTEVRRVQPHGPYLLGGLCIGGFIAFEIARKLRAAGEPVAMVALIDAAHVKAAPKSTAARRFQSFSASMRGPGRAGPGPTDTSPTGREPIGARLVRLAGVASKKASNVVRYEAKSRFTRQQNRMKVQLLRFCADHGLPLPRVVQHIPVRVILRFAEKEYVVPEPYRGDVFLYRATKKDPMFDGTLVDDTPYVDLFAEPMMGWQGKAERIHAFDLAGGHSSMLVPPYVDAVAALLQRHLDASLASTAGTAAGTPPGPPAAHTAMAAQDSAVGGSV